MAIGGQTPPAGLTFTHILVGECDRAQQDLLG